jgi:enoyl-CoA hydratase/carnithine racemase
MIMEQKYILTERNESVCTLSLNRPDKLNAVNDRLIEELCAALKAVNDDKTIKVIVLKGEGRAFCAGADLEVGELGIGTNEAQVRAETEQLQDITRQLLYSDKVVIGAIHGWAVGAGIEWAINCDFPIWAQSAKGFFPEAKWGLSVTGAITTLLPALVGPIKARELILLGEKHTADDFLRLGMAWKVVPDEQLIDEAMALANRLSSLHARSIADLKRGINLGSYTDIEKALAYETEIAVSAHMDPQSVENIRQFSEG